MCLRMRSVSSSLSKDKLLKEYSKSQQIKCRISRYATHNNKVSLKYKFSYLGQNNSLLLSTNRASLLTTNPKK